MTKEIVTSRGEIILLDDADYENLSDYKWRVNVSGYVSRYDTKTKKLIKLHRAIMQPPAGIDVDHINGNRLDNRRSNLRICTRQQNLQNQGARLNAKRAAISSQYKGVYWVKGKWEVRFWNGARLVGLGRFADEHEAASAYDTYAQVHHGEYFRPNISKQSKEAA